MFRSRILTVQMTALFAAVATPAWAQQAGLAVALVDAQTGQPAGGVEVSVTNDDIGFERTSISDEKGFIRLEGLTTAGTYTVRSRETADYNAAGPATLALRSNFTSGVTLSLTPAGGASIIVTGARVTALNTVNAEVSASLDAKELGALAIEGRDVIGALVRLPNVVASTGFFPEAPPISINGANGLDTNFLIDGLDNNENFLGGIKFPVPLGFTRDVTVLANSYSASYGRTANGIVNFTTPSGGNDPHGEAYVLVRPGRPLDARSPFPRRDLSGNAVGESFERYQGGVSLSGPISKDRTFIYANLEYTRDRNVQLVDAPALGAVGQITGHNQFYLGSVRIDHRLDDDWTLGLRANFGRVTIDRPGGGLGGGNATFPSAGSDQDRFSTLVALTASYSGEEWSYDGALQFSRFRWNYGKPKGPAGPQVTVRDPSGLTVGVLGHPGFVFNDLEESWQTTHRVQRTFADHKLTFGADVMRSTFALLGGGNPDGNYTVDLTTSQLAALAAGGKGLALNAQDVLSLNPALAPFGYSVELRPQSFGTGQTQFAAYVEDEWHLSPKLTATLGLRWDYDSLTAKGGKSGDKDNIAPRISVNYRPDARSTLRFGAGIYYGKLSYAVISDALQRNTTAPGFLTQLQQLQSQGLLPAGIDLSRLTFDGNLTVNPPCTTVSGCPTPAQVQSLRDTATLGEARILNPKGYQSPWSLQLSGGYQFQATDTLTLGADVIYSRSHNLVRLRDLNAPAPFTPNAASLTDANIALLRAQPTNAARLALAQSLGLVRSISRSRSSIGRATSSSMRSLEAPGRSRCRRPKDKANIRR